MAVFCMHHNDPDGRASAAIVRRALGPQVVFCEMNYGDPVPWEYINQADRVIIVDFSLPERDMLAISRSRELVWIDHHVTAMEALAPVSAAWPGIRSLDEAACVLTWQYFFPDQPVPRAVTLIADRDVWRWAEAETGPFDEGLYQENTDPTNDSLWVPLLNDDPERIAALTSRGEVLHEARLNNIRKQVDNYGFPVLFEGHRTLAINARGTGEIGEYVRSLGYEISYCYMDRRQNSNLVTFVTLYSNSVDVSKIAQQYGGGGHKDAAGFSFLRGATPFPPAARVSLE